MNSDYTPHWYVFPGSIDSHCHLKTMNRKGLPVNEILTRFFKEGGHCVIDIGTDASGWEERQQFSRDFPGRVFHSQGIHPTSLRDNWLEDLEQIQNQGDNPIAWGEIGLDYYHKNVDRDIQIKGFRRQLEIAREMKLPVIIHNREADADLFSILRDYPLEERGILHCFSSGPREAQEAVDRGLLLGINGNSTYKGSEGIRQAIKETPASAMVPDTDAPYLSPLPARGKPNHQGHLHLIYDQIAQIKGITPSEAVEESLRGFGELFPSLSAETTL